MTTMDFLLDPSVLGWLVLAATVCLWLVPVGLRAVRDLVYRRRVQQRFARLVASEKAAAAAERDEAAEFARQAASIVVRDLARPSLPVADPAAAVTPQPALRVVRPRVSRRRSPATSSYADDLASTLRKGHRVH